MQKEIWKEVVGYEDYYLVSSIGNIKSKDREVFNGRGTFTRKGKSIKLMVDKYGYNVVNLYGSFGVKTKKVHRLVADAFIENEQEKPQVNHINGVKSDNRVENLEWSSIKENITHAWDNGLMNPKRGENHHYSKLSKLNVLDIKRLINSGLNDTDISNLYGVHRRSINDIRNKRSWAHINH